ncbi:hypothetical protein GCM10023165_30520 [Variovorax defluvii]|uniref:Core-binding (CB) domain-containing protein n=1 Tax=Variovorax defluvii TaxID=913761 RepID=A0ABP8HWI1_9BURK
MDTITSAVTPLRQRMLEDMRMRKFEPRTQEAYVRAVRKLAAYLHRPPDTATVDELRDFQLHLVDSGTSPVTLNATLGALESSRFSGAGWVFRLPSIAPADVSMSH